MSEGNEYLSNGEYTMNMIRKRHFTLFVWNKQYVCLAVVIMISAILNYPLDCFNCCIGVSCAFSSSCKVLSFILVPLSV